MKRNTKEMLVKLAIYILFPVLFWCAVIGFALALHSCQPIVIDTASEVVRYVC